MDHMMSESQPYDSDDMDDMYPEIESLESLATNAIKQSNKIKQSKAISFRDTSCKVSLPLEASRLLARDLPLSGSPLRKF